MVVMASACLLQLTQIPKPQALVCATRASWVKIVDSHALPQTRVSFVVDVESAWSKVDMRCVSVSLVPEATPVNSCALGHCHLIKSALGMVSAMHTHLRNLWVQSALSVILDMLAPIVLSSAPTSMPKGALAGAMESAWRPMELPLALAMKASLEKVASMIAQETELVAHVQLKAVAKSLETRHSATVTMASLVTTAILSAHAI